MARQRLDIQLVARGLAPTRQAARAYVLAGLVIVDDRRVDKPGTPVDADSRISVKPPRSEYVSRGGTKLAGALDALGVLVQGKRTLDCGISTGGFADCLLTRGAAGVIGVDVGYGQVALKIRNDPRVTLLERTNLRYLAAGRLPYPPDLVTLDLSFISLALVLPAVRQLLARAGEVVALVKPQFEVGKGKVGKGGIVTDRELHLEVLQRVVEAARSAGFAVRGVVASPITGGDGNREFFVYLATDGPDREVDLAGVVAAGPAASLRLGRGPGDCSDGGARRRARPARGRAPAP